MVSGCLKSCNETATAFSAKAFCMCAVNPTNVEDGIITVDANRSLRAFQRPKARLRASMESITGVWRRSKQMRLSLLYVSNGIL